jgi:ABC-type glycerol-3-phosphate transport system permease component
MNARKQTMGALGLQYLILLLGTFFAVFPIYFVMQASLRPGNQLYTTDLQLFPSDATLDNFRYVLTQLPLLTWLRNSITIAAATTVATMRAVSMPLNPFHLVFDRPFTWAVEHAPSGTLLFVGRVRNPTERSD